jgi:methyl-accepting chemotaxis protein
MIKNISVSMKLWFIILPAILALAGLLILFIVRSDAIESQSKKRLYDEVFISTALILNADRDLYQAANDEKELILTPSLTDDARAALIDDFNENADQVKERITAAIDNIKGNMTLYADFSTGDITSTLEKLAVEFWQHYDAWLKGYDLTNMTGDLSARQDEFALARDDIDQMTGLLEAYAQTVSAQLKADVKSSVTVSVIVVSAVALLILVMSLVIIISLRGRIKYITEISQKIAAGELSMTIDAKFKSRDEIGRLCTATGDILNQLNAYDGYIDEITNTLTAMAGGDMCIDLKHDYSGRFRSIRDAFIGVADSLGRTLNTIITASEQVRQGSAMIADGAQTLAHGSTRQASAVEELSSTIDAVSEETVKNANGITLAVGSLEATLKKIDESNSYMDQMLGSMSSIGDTSSKIKTVIKLIDDIAFQTNILALNAAVEAARAGQYGKGFAVVAAEVKNLATKSADAANQTSELIGSSISTIQQGITIAKSTASALADVSNKVNQVNSIFTGISSSSLKQAGAMREIKAGIIQISSVVTTNTATAEESASASEQLSSQAELLYTEVSHFNISGEDARSGQILRLPKR